MIIDKLRNAVLAILMLCLSISLTDVVFTYAYKSVHGYLLLTPDKKHRKVSPLFHHDLNKCSSGLYDQWGMIKSAFKTNSLGFRDRATRNIDLKQPQNRIVIIGDSFTEGVGVIYEDSFVGQLDNSNKIETEVLNAAVASYSPIIYWRKTKYLIEEAGLKFNHLIVYMDVSDISDEANSYKLSSTAAVIDKTERDNKVFTNKIITHNADCGNFALLSLKDFIWKHTTLIYFFYDYKKQIQKIIKARENHKNNLHFRNSQTPKRLLKNVINFEKANWTIDDELMEQYGNTGLQQAVFYMDKLSQLLKSNDIKLTVAVYPWPTQIWHDDLNSIQVTFWKNWAEQNQAGFINHFPDFVKGGSDEEKTEFIRQHYIWADSHFNEAGHKLIAEKLINYLKETAR